MEYPCVVCKKDVGNDDKAFQCEVCEEWEHVDCIRECERPDSSLYDCLVRCRTKCLSFICTRCRKKGSLVKQFMKFEYELAKAHDEQLASARQLEEAEARAQQSELTVGKLEYERDELQAEVKKLYEQLTKVQLDSPVNKPVPAKSPVNSSEMRTKCKLSHKYEPQSEHKQLIRV